MIPPLVKFNADDAPALLALSESIGWPHELSDWRTALAASRIFGHRAEDATVLSSSALYLFNPGFAALALVIVREELRGRGLARAAVEECLRQAPDAAVILVATEYGEPLYRKLGFRTVQQVVRLIAPEGASPGAEVSCAAMTEADLADALELDRAAYGCDRGVALRKRWQSVERGVMLRDTAGAAQGFAWMTRQRGGLVIGPVIAPSAREAGWLVRSLAGDERERLKLEVPDDQTEFIAALKGAGFATDSARAVMVKNAEQLPGERSRIFALASLGYG